MDLSRSLFTGVVLLRSRFLTRQKELRSVPNISDTLGGLCIILLVSSPYRTLRPAPLQTAVPPPPRPAEPSIYGLSIKDILPPFGIRPQYHLHKGPPFDILILVINPRALLSVNPTLHSRPRMCETKPRTSHLVSPAARVPPCSHRRFSSNIL